jgi:hypothetical protein
MDNPTTTTSLPSGCIALTFQPIKMKIFRSKKMINLIIIECCCTHGSLNCIRSGDKAQVRIRRSSSLSTRTTSDATIISDIDSLPTLLLKDVVETTSFLDKGCWVDASSTKRLVMHANANIELNRKGERLVECTELLAIQEYSIIEPSEDDASNNEIFRVQKYHEINNNNIADIITFDQIDIKSERHKIFAHWLIRTYGKDMLSTGSGVLDVAGGNGTICQTLNEMGIPSTLLDPNPRNINTSTSSSFKVIPLPLNGDGADLTTRDDDIGMIINNCSFICGLHPDQATESIVLLALRLNVPFAIV